jgi:tetratricopeptide (TPR) repeat protein
VTDRLVIDLGEDGQVSVAVEREHEPFTPGTLAALSWPLDDGALEDLRWYLEDYLGAPYGVYEDRGARIDAALPRWGQQVFSSVFGSGPARDAYLRAREHDDVELVFRSASPSLLGLPWELMADPGRPAPLALDVAGVSRSLLMTADSAQTISVPGGRLRVLMVISRPSGRGDVGYRMIARPLLDRLEAVRGTVDLVVLRPPTLAALRAELASAAAAGTPYQVVHFDGHGVMPSRSVGTGSPLMFTGHAPEGVLAFEKPGGGEDLVLASQVAQVLVDAMVPVVVLNACQSGAVGRELEAAIATRLLHEGVASVVAMAYSVYAVAAAEFMAAFYERLFAGGTVAAAVTAGRKQMFSKPGRPSPKGDLPLKDWLVPVHYFRREVRFPQAVVARPAGLPPLAEALKALSAVPGEAGRGDLDAVDGVFVGRDGLFYDLEAAARLQKIVVMVGPGGTGKTELAKAFGRWWRDTGGVEQSEWVFWHSFEPGVATFGLDGVVSKIGLGLYGAQFSLLEAEQRRAVVLDALTSHRMLLIWDNFESVRSMPDPGRATPPLEEAGRAELREFLAALAAGGKSSVLITSRTTEDWLGELRRIQVGGLAKHEGYEYADILLAPYPSARERRKGRPFGDLMQWLDGHPLTMRLVLPRLDTTNPQTLLAGLQGTAPLADHDGTVRGRTRSLAASVAYSYAHLAEPTRRLLPAVSLFRGVADADVLAVFSQAPQVPERFVGATEDDWSAALDDAAGVGLLTGLDAGIYRIHPALPGFLATAWRSEETGSWDATRDAAISALLTAHATLGDWLNGQIKSGDAGLANAVIELESHNLGSALGYAIDCGLWEPAQDILEPLDDFWDARGLDVEAGAWADRVRSATEGPDGTPPLPDNPAGAVWRFVTGSQANRELNRGHLDAAETAYLQIMGTLQLMEASPGQQRHLGNTYHQLGRVAEERGSLTTAQEWYHKSLAVKGEADDQYGTATSYHQLGNIAYVTGRLDSAQEWYQKALAIGEKLGRQPYLAICYHQLGMVAQDRGELEAAEDWYRKALALKEAIGDLPGISSTYHQLGMVAQDRGELDVAERRYQDSLAIEEELGNRQGMAISYHQLGMVAEDRGELDEAEQWYLKSLAIKEEIGNWPATAATYHHLGKVAEKRGELDDAEQRHRKSLAVEEELGNRPGMATSYHQLGRVAENRGDARGAEDWYRKSLAIKEEFGDRPGMALTYGQLAFLDAKQERPPEALAWTVRCVALFDEIPQPAIEAESELLALLTDYLGIPVLESTWREITGNELPRAVQDYVEAWIRDNAD